MKLAAVVHFLISSISDKNQPYEKLNLKENETANKEIYQGYEYTCQFNLQKQKKY